MHTRRLGKSPLEVSPIIFGAWAIGGWYWGGTDDQQSINAIHTAVDAGINAIDTAPIYGFGHSETVVGKALKGIRNQVLIMTKVGLRWDSEEGQHFFDVHQANGKKRVFRNLQAKSIRQEIENSLQRMQIDHIDLCQCHWPDPSTPIEETMETFATLHQEGKIRAVGVSNFDTTLLERAQKSLGHVPLASNQPRYSLLDRRIEAKILPWLCKHDVGTIVYSPIAQGLLAGAVPPDRQFPSNDGRSRDPLFKKQNRIDILAALDDIHYIAQNHQCTLAQLAAAWCFHQSGITAAIVGIRTPKQATENAHALSLQLTAAECQHLHQRFSTLACCQQ